MAASRLDLATICALALLAAAAWLVPGPPLLAKQTGETVRARVVSVDNSGLSDVGLLKYGSQTLKAEVLEGRFKGETFECANEVRAQLEFDKIFAPEDVALVVVDGKSEPGKSVLVARDHWRLGWMAVLFGAFCVLLCAFGGWTGAKALASFVFSCVAIWKVLVPLCLRGWPASWTSFAVVVVMTGAIMVLVAGWTRKGLAASLGAALGVFSGLAMAHVFGRLMHVSGATMPFAQSLLYSGFADLDLADLFIGAVLLAESGAVMDLAMDVAAGVAEVARHNPSLSGLELARSGLRIGRSVVGTMTTTLLLAYSGGYLTLLMVFAAQGTAPFDFLNSTLVSAEAVKTLVGSFSLVLVAPATAFVSAWLMRKGEDFRGAGVDGKEERQ